MTKNLSIMCVCVKHCSLLVTETRTFVRDTVAYFVVFFLPINNNYAKFSIN